MSAHEAQVQEMMGFVLIFIEKVVSTIVLAQSANEASTNSLSGLFLSTDRSR
jgi:hypothetical protein